MRQKNVALFRPLSRFYWGDMPPPPPPPPLALPPPLFLHPCVELIVDLCLLLNRKHHRSGRITQRNAEPYLHGTTSVQPKPSEEKMVIGKVSHIIHYGATLIPIR